MVDSNNNGIPDNVDTIIESISTTTAGRAEKGNEYKFNEATFQQAVTAALAADTNLAAIKANTDNLLTEVENQTVLLRNGGFISTTSFTRPNDATPYTAGDIINATGSSSMQYFDLSSVNGAANRQIEITSVSIWVSVANSGLAPVLYFFNSTTLASQTMTDNTAYNPSAADLMAYCQKPIGFRGEFSNASLLVPESAVSTASFYEASEISRFVTLDSNGYLPFLLGTRSTFTPTSGAIKKITISGNLR